MKTKDGEHVRGKQASAMVGIAPNTMRRWGRAVLFEKNRVRKMLNGAGLIDIQDPTYIIGERAAKWSPSEEFWAVATSLYFNRINLLDFLFQISTPHLGRFRLLGEHINIKLL